MHMNVHNLINTFLTPCMTTARAAYAMQLFWPGHMCLYSIEMQTKV